MYRWFDTLFAFLPVPGEMIQFDDHIFSKGLRETKTSVLNGPMGLLGFCNVNTTCNHGQTTKQGFS